MSATWYCNLCEDSHLGNCPLPPDDPRRLRESLDTQMQRVAGLRGYSGQLRGAVREALKIVESCPGGWAGSCTEAQDVLRRALLIPVPDSEAA